MALSLRQTNAVWIVFALGSVTLLELSPAVPLHTPLHTAIPRLVLELSRNLFPRPFFSRHCGSFREGLLPRHWPLILLLLIFVAFVLHNGAVVVGDAAHHAPALHLAQLLHLAAYASLPFELHQFAAALASGPLTSIGAAMRAAFAPRHRGLLMAAAAAAAAATHWSYCHPFLLADNRHLTFYLQRHLLRSAPRRFALLPAYLLSGAALIPRLVRARGPAATTLLLTCCALVLVPSPLLELRYFTLPVLLLRTHAEPLAGAKEWLPPLLLFAAINAAAVAIFLYRPFVWGDGTIARFMW